MLLQEAERRQRQEQERMEQKKALELQKQKEKQAEVRRIAAEAEEASRKRALQAQAAAERKRKADSQVTAPQASNVHVYTDIQCIAKYLLAAYTNFSVASRIPSAYYKIQCKGADIMQM